MCICTCICIHIYNMYDEASGDNVRLFKQQLFTCEASVYSDAVIGLQNTKGIPEKVQYQVCFVCMSILECWPTPSVFIEGPLCVGMKEVIVEYKGGQLKIKNQPYKDKAYIMKHSSRDPLCVL